jgi:hypothetical protein
MANFPASIASFTARAAGGVIASAHMNSVQDEITAEQTQLTALGLHLIPSRASAYNNAAQVIPHDTVTTLTMNAEDYDTGSMHSTVSATSRLTIPSGQAGFYVVMGRALFAANATGLRQLRLIKSDAGVVDLDRGAGSAADSTVLRVVWMGSIAAGAYFELSVYQDSGGDLNAGSTDRFDACALQAVKVWTV